MHTFERIFVAINKWVLVLLLAAMSSIVFANVSLRYLSNFSITWAEEVARYLMIWMTFLGAGLSLRIGGHVAITNLHDFLGTRPQRLLRAFIGLLLICFFVAMMWIGYEYMNRMGRQLTPATRIPFSYIYAAMPIGFALMIAHFLLIARSYILGEDLPTDNVPTEGAAG
ncbi:MAG: TRAP transporter small permease [Neoaquamicrobium sediminum]|uniref:TRAP transporter small permease n=1 Tax=Neoaquamicrobium sediminum TaxID=1849104 RepID=UPI0040371D4D